MLQAKKWIINSRNPFEIHGHAIKRCILSRKTQYQHIEIIETYNYGITLVLDGIPQSSQLDEFIYHEAIVHPALCTHPSPINVLVIGGGEGATIREVLKHPSVEHVVMVDIDHELLNICREYLVDWHRGAFSDPRTELICADGFSFLQDCRDRFDCIILDLSDPFEGSPASKLFTTEFYQIARTALRRSGILSLQAESGALGHNESHCRIIQTLSRVFPNVLPYYTYIPLYATLYGFAICGDNKLSLERVAAKEVDATLKQRGISTLQFYNNEVAQGLFAVPTYIREQIQQKTGEAITLESPLSVSL